MGKMGKAELALRQELQIEGKCGAITRKGVPCERPAGYGTDHRGSGPCHIHDKFRQVVERRPGSRYSQGIAENALDHFLALAEDPEITRLDDEIALLRMRLDDINHMINDIRARYQDKTKQQIRLGEYLHAAYGERGDPSGTADQKALLQLTRDSAKMAESIAKLVAQKTRIEEGRIVTYRQVHEVLAQVVYVIKHHVVDEEVLSRIAEDFARIDVSKFEPR